MIDLYQLNSHFLQEIIIYISDYNKKVKLNKNSEFKFYSSNFKSCDIYSSSGNSSALTQAWNQVAVIARFYPSLKSSSVNLGTNVSISSQAQATCWCLGQIRVVEKDTYKLIVNMFKLLFQINTVIL